MSNYVQKGKEYTLDTNINIVFIRAEFNEEYTKALEKINEDFFLSSGFSNIKKFTVPGAYELPGFAKQVYDTLKPDLIVCLWVVVRWGTTHYEHVAWECFRWLMNLSIASDIAMINGVLTCENNAQVEERITPTFAISGLNLLEMRKKIK